MLNNKNRELIATTYLDIALLESGMKLKFDNETKRTYHFKMKDVKVSIPKKSLKEFFNKYK